MPQTMGLAPGYKLRRWRAAVATAHAVCVVCQHVWVKVHVCMCVCVCAQLQLQSTTTPTQRVEKNMRKFAVKSVGQTRLPCPCPGQTFRFSRFGTQPEPEPEPVQCVCVCAWLTIIQKFYKQNERPLHGRRAETETTCKQFSSAIFGFCPRRRSFRSTAVADSSLEYFCLVSDRNARHCH